MNTVEKIVYLPHLPTVKSGGTGRNVTDYATTCAVINILIRDLLTFPEGNRGEFKDEDLVEAVCAEVRPFDDYLENIMESDFIKDSIQSLIQSGFLHQGSDGKISCPYVTNIVIGFCGKEQQKIIEPSEDMDNTEDDLLPELF